MPLIKVEIHACEATFSDADLESLAKRCCANAEGLKLPKAEDLTLMRTVQQVDPDALVIAFYGENPVGMCAVALPDDGEAACLRFLGVDPVWRCQGIGKTLETHAVSIALRHGYSILRTEAVMDSRNGVGIRFLEHLGWELTSGGIRMWRDLENLPPIELSLGYTIRSYQPGDDSAFVRIKNAAFSGWEEWTSEDFKKEFLESPHFHPERVFFAVYHRGDENELVGTATAWARIHEGREVGCLHWVAVLPEHQRKGLGRALSLKALCKMREVGYSEVILGTMEQLRSAVRLYHRIGFQILYRHSTIYEKQDNRRRRIM